MMEYNRYRRYQNQMSSNQNQSTPPPNSNDWVVAMAYVPWQTYTETFDLSRGFQTGTIFPELNKPFMAAGRCARS
ncbi:hypothetical protein P261_02726 [Lachnospiraceae bacterium TWA4]|nr:hypothetical protein P261_02726 [Lachnospiraceae bacterium TWA4]